MSGLSCRSGSPPSAVEAAGPSDAPENLRELLGDAIPFVQALLRTLLKLDRLNEFGYTERQLALVQKLAAAPTSNLGRLGRDELSDYIFMSAYILKSTAVLISRWQSPANAHNAAALALLQPAPARAALLRLLAAMMRWEPGVQLPAASGGGEDEQRQDQAAAWEPGVQLPPATGTEQRVGQPGTCHDDASAPSSAEESGQLCIVAAAAAAADEQGQQPLQAAVGYNARLAQELLDLRKGVCQLVSQVLGPSNRSAREVDGYSTHRLLLCLDFSCSLLQARVLHCLSRQLAAASEGLVGQLPPEVAAAPQPMRGQQQQQQQQQQHGAWNAAQQGEEGAPSPLGAPLSAAQGQPPGQAASTSSNGLTGPLRAAKQAVRITTSLMPCLYTLMSLAADVHRSASPIAVGSHGSGSSSGPGPSHGSQPPAAAGTTKQLRQLSRRFLLLLAGGLRDSHLHDHWARAVLLAGLCRGPEEQGGEEEGGEREAWIVRNRLLAMEEWVKGVRDLSGVGCSTEGGTQVQAAGEAAKHEHDRLGLEVSGEAVGGEREERTVRKSLAQGPGVAGGDREVGLEGAGVSRGAGQVATLLVADAAGEGPQRLQIGHSGADEHLLCTFIYSTGSVLMDLSEAATSGSSNSPGRSLPPGLCTALQHALSGPCTQHLTLALGTLMLHQADGGSLYGMPLPYRTGALAEALAAATLDLVAGGSGPPALRVLDMSMYANLQRLLSYSCCCVPQPLPAVPLAGHLDLLLRLGRLAVRSAQAYRGQEGGMGPRVVIGRGDIGDVAVTCLVAARALLYSRAGTTSSGVGAAAAVALGTGTGPGAAGAGEGLGGAGAAGAVASRAAGAALRAARAAVAAETRWHRLLLDTGLWAEMEGGKLAAWAEAWSHLESLGHLEEGTGALPTSAPAPVAGALAAGVLPCLERVLRRAGERATRGPRFNGEPPLLQGLLSYECRWRPWLGWLLSYGDVRQGAAFMVTLRKMALQGQGQQQRQRRALQRIVPDEHTAATLVTYRKAATILKYAVQLGRQAGAAGDDSGGGGGGCYDSGGGSGFPAVPGGQVGAAGMDSPGLPRLQLLLWYGVRHLIPHVAQVAVANETSVGGSWSKGVARWTEAYTLMGDVLRPVAVLALQIASGSDGSSGGDGGGGSSRSSDAGGGGGGSSRDSSRAAEGNDGGAGGSAGLSSCNGSSVAEGSGGSSSSPPTWLSSWQRVLLEEWRVVELVGSALELMVPAVGSNISAAIVFDKFNTMQSLVVALCSVALAFPDRVWSAAGGPGAGTQVKERQAEGSQRGGGRSSKGGGKRAAPASAQSLPVCLWPTGKLIQLLGAVRAQCMMGYARCLEPELDALSELVDLVKAGGPKLPYKDDMPFVRAALRLKTDSELLGGFRWLCDGSVPTPELLDGLLRTCSYPRCASLEGDSEAGAEGRLAACGRGCGGAWYCCRACAKAHWREGHAEACGGGATAAASGGMGGGRGKR